MREIPLIFPHFSHFPTFRRIEDEGNFPHFSDSCSKVPVCPLYQVLILTGSSSSSHPPVRLAAGAFSPPTVWKDPTYALFGDQNIRGDFWGTFPMGFRVDYLTFERIPGVAGAAPGKTFPQET